MDVFMHNKVNEKLLRQGENLKSNPSFESVYKKYEVHMASCEYNTCNRKE